MLTYNDVVNCIQINGYDWDDHKAIADKLSETAFEYVSTEIGNGLIIDTLGLAVGSDVLDAIYNVPEYRYVKPLLERGALDVNTDLVRNAIDTLVQVIPGFSAELAEDLKNLARRNVSVSITEVAAIIQRGA